MEELWPIGLEWELLGEGITLIDWKAKKTQQTQLALDV
jgi:hypothetical protein